MKSLYANDAIAWLIQKNYVRRVLSLIKFVYKIKLIIFKWSEFQP